MTPQAAEGDVLLRPELQRSHACAGLFRRAIPILIWPFRRNKKGRNSGPSFRLGGCRLEPRRGTQQAGDEEGRTDQGKAQI